MDGTREIALAGHNKSVECVTVTPDGTQIISGGRDKTLKLWQVDAIKLQIKGD